MRRQTVPTDERGSVLLLSCIVIISFFLLGASLYTFMVGEAHATERHRDQRQALAIAEAGLERALTDLRQDLQGSVLLGSWSDGDINGMTCLVDTERFHSLPYADTDLSNGSYVVEVRNVVGKDDEIWVRATGSVLGSAQAVQAFVRGEAYSCWDNAIFAGSGSDGLLINGNVQIAGSVHILGNKLGPDDVAMDMSGAVALLNNHSTMPGALKTKIAPIAPTTVNGETVESLHAALRVRHGQVGFSGGAAAGFQDAAGNSIKETLDGAYVTDGFTGTQGANAVSSDNGTGTAYDLGDSMDFPQLTAPYEGEPSYLAWLQKQALVIKEPARVAQLGNLTPTAKFSYVDPAGKGSISCDGKGNLTISGIVCVDGPLNFRGSGPADTFNYSGRGSLVATGSVNVNANLLAAGVRTYPTTNIMAIMTPADLSFTGAQRGAMGLFYAEDKITSTKQTNVIGSFVSDYFDMGQQVPSIFYTPVPRGCYPPGLIGLRPTICMRLFCWQRVEATVSAVADATP